MASPGEAVALCAQGVIPMTDRYAVIGNPIEQSKSPLIHAEYARACGQDMAYERLLGP